MVIALRTMKRATLLPILRTTYSGSHFSIHGTMEIRNENMDYITNLNVITSPTNEKVKLLKSLQLKKKRDSEMLVLLEGHRQVIDAITFGCIPSIVLISEMGINSAQGDLLLTKLKESTNISSTVYKCPDHIIQSVSDTVNCQGIVAAFSKPKTSTIKRISDTTNEKPLVILLDRLADPGNVGTIIRTAYGMGAVAVVVVDGCDPWSPKALRSAMGMCLRLPIYDVSWPQVPSLLQEEFGDMQVLLADVALDSKAYYEANFDNPTLLVIGSEAHGISKEALTLTNAKKIFIPSAPGRELESLNAAVACSIILGEAARQRRMHFKIIEK